MAETGSRRLYDLVTAARELGGLSIWTVRAHVARGSIATVRIGRRVFVSHEELDRIVREGLPALTTVQKAVAA